MDKDSHSAPNARGGPPKRYQELGGGKRIDHKGSNKLHLVPGARLSENGSKWDCADETHRGTDRSLERFAERVEPTQEPVVKEPIAEFSFQPVFVPQESPEVEEDSWYREHDSNQASKGSHCGIKTTIGKGGPIAGSSARFDLDKAIPSDVGPRRDPQETHYDCEIDLPFKSRIVSFIQQELLPKMPPLALPLGAYLDPIPSPMSLSFGMEATYCHKSLLGAPALSQFLSFSDETEPPPHLLSASASSEAAFSLSSASSEVLSPSNPSVVSPSFLSASSEAAISPSSASSEATISPSSASSEAPLQRPLCGPSLLPSSEALSLNSRVFSQPSQTVASSCVSPRSRFYDDSSHRLKPQDENSSLNFSMSAPFVLNPPVVETIKWEELSRFVPEERWEIISVILDPVKFREKVLEGVSSPNLLKGRRPVLPLWVQKQIISLGYVRRAHRGCKCSCPIFCVPRPDGKLRLIWDGRNLNSICRSPPHFHLHTTLDHVRKLFQSHIKCLYSFDMKTWFVQLAPHHRVAEYFGTIMHDGLYILVGLPMGWSWAPVVAQFSAEGIATAIAEALPDLKLHGIVIVYIDNLILGLPERLASQKDLVVNKVSKVCERLGAVIKKGSEFWGTVVEWLGLEINCERQVFRLKESFIEKMKKFHILETPWSDLLRSYRWWYSLLSSIVYSVWNTQGDLNGLWEVVWFMSILARNLRSNASGWDDVVYFVPPSIQSLIVEKMKSILSNSWQSPPLGIENTVLRAVGISDASNLSLAWGSHSEKMMKLSISFCPCSTEHVIFERELKAMILGQTEVIRELPPNSRVRWLGDNMGALFVSRRSLSCVWKVNSWLEKLHALKATHQVVVEYEFVPSELNIMDTPSRTGRSLSISAPACSLHPASLCPCFYDWIKSSL